MIKDSMMQFLSEQMDIKNVSSRDRIKLLEDFDTSSGASRYARCSTEGSMGSYY
jgi:hypothetical protein